MNVSRKLTEAHHDIAELIKTMAEQIEGRDIRIRQLEKLNSQLAIRIDQLEAERNKYSVISGHRLGDR